MPFELPSSPYAGNALEITFKDGQKHLARRKLVHTPALDDDYHILTEHDTLGDLAFRYYGDAKYWWVIADINDIDNPLILPYAETVIIPKLNNISYA